MTNQELLTHILDYLAMTQPHWIECQHIGPNDDVKIAQFQGHPVSQLYDAFDALDIIINHRMDMEWFRQFVDPDTDYETYLICLEEGDNKFAQRFMLSREEFNLLKRVLKQIIIKNIN